MLIAVWILTLLMLALWTLGAWALAALLGADAGWVDRVQAWLFDAPWRAALDAWVPGWTMATQAALDALQSLLVWLGGTAPWLVWGAWGLGAVALLAMGGVLSLIVVLVRRGTAPTCPPAPAAT